MKIDLVERFSKHIYSSSIINHMYDIYKIFWTAATSRFHPGMNIYEEDWDVLIVLDTCRVDALQFVADEYGFIENIDSIISVGSTSAEWIANTFTQDYSDEIASTGYVSANAFAKRVIEERKLPPGTSMSFEDYQTVQAEGFQYLEQVWELNPGHPYGYTMPGCTTDRAISVGRNHDFNRYIIHYTPPHSPYIANALNGRRLADHESDPFSALRDGTDFETVWDAYLDNLRLGLDNVELLLKNLDADRVVITADHGEAFGDFGIYNHGTGIVHPHVIRVPWVTTSARDTESYSPSLSAPNQDESTKERLRDLGYL